MVFLWHKQIKLILPINLLNGNNKRSGIVIPIEQVNGQYEFDLFVPKEDHVLGVESNVDEVKYTGVWSALVDEDDEVDMRSTFIGLV
jgi:hypothetical protein